MDIQRRTVLLGLLATSGAFVAPCARARENLADALKDPERLKLDREITEAFWSGLKLEETLGSTHAGRNADKIRIELFQHSRVLGALIRVYFHMYGFNSHSSVEAMQEFKDAGREMTPGLNPEEQEKVIAKHAVLGLGAYTGLTSEQLSAKRVRAYGILCGYFDACRQMK